jgi:nucleotide-binding universal stress UspA family protein
VIYLSELKLVVEQQKIDIAEEESSTTTSSSTATTAESATTKATTTTTTTASQKIIITFSKVLVAIDGSDASMDAADYAIFISKEYNAELLYALHVIHPADVDLSFGQIKEEIPPSSYYVVSNTNNEAQKYLDKVKLMANEKNVQIKTEIITSTNVAGAIVDYAEDKDVDLIVVGTRGKSGFKKVLLGSVAEDVVTYAHCPVLVVK